MRQARETYDSAAEGSRERVAVHAIDKTLIEVGAGETPGGESAVELRVGGRPYVLASEQATQLVLLLSVHAYHAAGRDAPGALPRRNPT